MHSLFGSSKKMVRIKADLAKKGIKGGGYETRYPVLKQAIWLIVNTSAKGS